MFVLTMGNDRQRSGHCRWLAVRGMGNTIGNRSIHCPVGNITGSLAVLLILLLKYVNKGSKAITPAYTHIYARKGWNIIGNGHRQ